MLKDLELGANGRADSLLNKSPTFMSIPLRMT